MISSKKWLVLFCCGALAFTTTNAFLPSKRFLEGLQKEKSRSTFSERDLSSITWNYQYAPLPHDHNRNLTGPSLPVILQDSSKWNRLTRTSNDKNNARQRRQLKRKRRWGYSLSLLIPKAFQVFLRPSKTKHIEDDVMDLEDVLFEKEETFVDRMVHEAHMYLQIDQRVQRELGTRIRVVGTKRFAPKNRPIQIHGEAVIPSEFAIQVKGSQAGGVAMAMATHQHGIVRLTLHIDGRVMAVNLSSNTQRGQHLPPPSSSGNNKKDSDNRDDDTIDIDIGYSE